MCREPVVFGIFVFFTLLAQMIERLLGGYRERKREMSCVVSIRFCASHPISCSLLPLPPPPHTNTHTQTQTRGYRETHTQKTRTLTPFFFVFTRGKTNGNGLVLVDMVCLVGSGPGHAGSVLTSTADKTEGPPVLDAQQLHPPLRRGGRGRPLGVPGRRRARAAHARDHVGAAGVGLQRGEQSGVWMASVVVVPRAVLVACWCGL